MRYRNAISYAIANVSHTISHRDIACDIKDIASQGYRMRYRNAISYTTLLVIAYDIKDIANAIKKISHEISLRYRNDAISHAISHLTRIQMLSCKHGQARTRTRRKIPQVSCPTIFANGFPRKPGGACQPLDTAQVLNTQL